MERLNNGLNIDAFYDSISKCYTDSIKRCVPDYEEMLKSLFIFINPNFLPHKILELGCGTGNFTQLLNQGYPNATITAVDISEECINECKSRISSSNGKYIKCDFKEIDFPENNFDLVISSISIHHLKDFDKKNLFQKLHKFQTPKGILSFCDQFSGENDFIYQKHIDLWKSFALKQGASIDEWEMWMKHQLDHDYHSTLANHLLWIKDAGYKLVDCTRKHLLWTTIYAEK